MEVQKGLVSVKIFRARNRVYLVGTKTEKVREKERFSFMVFYFADGKRRQKMFVDFEEAHAESTRKKHKGRFHVWK